MRSPRTTGLAAALGIALFSIPAGAADGKTIPLSAKTKAELALLGEGVVGKAVPAPALTDVTPYLNLGEGAWEFKIVSGKEKGKTQKEVFKQEGDNRWARTIGDEYLEHLTIGGKDASTKTAETALSFGYRSTFTPGIHETKGMAPGESIKIESKLAVSTEKEPDKVKYTGTMKADVKYEGAYEVTVPAGTFEALLFSIDVKIHVGPADVEDTQYLFYAKNVGKVAEIESQKVAAVLLYHSKDKTAKVLTAYPKR